MNIKLEIAFFILIGLILLIEIFWIFRTEKRLKRFFKGKKSGDLEETIISLSKEIKQLYVAKEKTEKELLEINTKLRKSIRGLKVTRFNPFPDQGGNQSFAIAMLNEDKEGLVLSSLYSRERTSVFAKPIIKGGSQYELTKEEKEVLKKASISN